MPDESLLLHFASILSVLQKEDGLDVSWQIPSQYYPSVIRVLDRQHAQAHARYVRIRRADCLLLRRTTRPWFLLRMFWMSLPRTVPSWWSLSNTRTMPPWWSLSSMSRSPTVMQSGERRHPSSKTAAARFDFACIGMFSLTLGRWWLLLAVFCNTPWNILVAICPLHISRWHAERMKPKFPLGAYAWRMRWRGDDAEYTFKGWWMWRCPHNVVTVCNSLTKFLHTREAESVIKVSSIDLVLQEILLQIACHASNLGTPGIVVWSAAMNIVYWWHQAESY